MNQDDAIKKANERWLRDEKPKEKTRKEKNRIARLLATKHVRHEQWSGKAYRTVRG